MQPTAKLKHGQFWWSFILIHFQIRMRNPHLFGSTSIKCSIQELQDSFHVGFRHTSRKLAKALYKRLFSCQSLLLSSHESEEPAITRTVYQITQEASTTRIHFGSRASKFI